jgi:osmotically-inducible protein OsmY
MTMSPVSSSNPPGPFSAGGPGLEQDDRLRAEVSERLRASGYLLLRELRCEVLGGVVTLSGRVPSFHLKQVAQAVLLKVEAVRAVKNLVEVP